MSRLTRPIDGEIALASRERRARVWGADCDGKRWEAELRRFEEWEPNRCRETRAGDLIFGRWVTVGTARGHASVQAAVEAAKALAVRRGFLVAATVARRIAWCDRYAVREEERTCTVCGVDIGARCSLHVTASPRLVVTYTGAEFLP